MKTAIEKGNHNELINTPVKILSKTKEESVIALLQKFEGKA